MEYLSAMGKNGRDCLGATSFAIVSNAPMKTFSKNMHCRQSGFGMTKAMQVILKFTKSYGLAHKTVYSRGTKAVTRKLYRLSHSFI